MMHLFRVTRFFVKLAYYLGRDFLRKFVCYAWDHNYVERKGDQYNSRTFRRFYQCARCGNVPYGR